MAEDQAREGTPPDRRGSQEIGPIAESVLRHAKRVGNSQPLPNADRTPTSDLCDPECDVCGGSGYIRYDVPYTHPLFGKLDLCPNVDRWNLPYARRFGITKDEARKLNWNAIIDVGDAKIAVRKVKKILARGYGWAYLYGGNGLAKTLLLKVAVAHALKNDTEASYTRMAEIMDHLRAAFDDNGGSPASEERLEWWSDIPVLAIDEFDRLRDTEFAQERRFLLMDRRYESALRKESITIMASEVSPSGLESYLSDRIYDGRFEMIGLTGDSLRPGMDWD